MEDIIETLLGLEIIDENDQVVDMQLYAKEKYTFTILPCLYLI